MHEEDFDSLAQQRGWQAFDAATALARMRRLGALWLGLWGRTAEDLERQLLAPHPEIPAGFGVEDLRDLERRAELVMVAMRNPLMASLFKPGGLQALAGGTVLVGTRRLSAWEARREILRRAIEYLEGR